MFSWSIIVPVEILIYVSALYLVYLFANEQKDISLKPKLVVIGLCLPIFLLAHTSYNLLGFDFTNCDREAIEGPLTQYLYLLEFVLTFWALVIAVLGYRKIKDKIARRQLLAVSIGTLLFMFLFSAGNVVVTYFLEFDWSYEQYKLFGMPIFVAFIAYSIVRFKAFNAKLLGVQALVAGLSIAVFSLLFVRTIDNVRIIAGLTFFLVLVLGYSLVKSVKREIENRERMQALAKDLEKANQQQIILIHFVTHQLKGFVTKSRNAFSMLLEGDFGQVPETMRPIVEEGFRSDTKGVDTIQEILNAANIKSGKVTYTKSPIDLKELVEGVVADLKPNADAKDLALSITADGEDFTLQGDRMQLTNAVKNMIDNSIKYTPEGSVAISLARENDAVRLTISDTGVGISPEDMQVLFTEGGHGKESRKLNVESTGFGLYIVKNIIEAHQGKVWAESHGPGKGSRFIVELPLG